MAEEKISFWLTTIDVCGVQVPTKQSCVSMSELLKGNLDNWRIFCGYNNYLVSIYETHFNPNDYLSTCDPSERHGLNLKSRLVEIDRNITDYSGCFDFAKLRVARAIFEWHRTVRGNYTGTDTQQLLKALRQVQKGKYNFYDIKFPSKKDYSHLLETRVGMSDSERQLNNEFIDAYDYIKRLDKYVDGLSLTDEYVRILLLEKVYIIRELLNLPKISDPPKFIFTCPFCNKSKIIHQQKKPKACGSQDCSIYMYKKDWETKNRPRKTSDPDGWVLAFDGKRKICKGARCNDGENEFGRLRQVNTDYLCRECFTESRARQGF